MKKCYQGGDRDVAGSKRLTKMLKKLLNAQSKRHGALDVHDDRERDWTLNSRDFKARVKPMGLARTIGRLLVAGSFIGFYAEIWKFPLNHCTGSLIGIAIVLFST